jgi:hypothetical protein
VAIAEEAPDEVLEVAQAKDDPLARFVLARILSQTAAHSHLQWDTLVEGEGGLAGLLGGDSGERCLRRRRVLPACWPASLSPTRSVAAGA